MPWRSPRLAWLSTGVQRLPAGSDSPVSIASSMRRSRQSSRRRSAGTRSPASSRTMSPGTSCSAGSVWITPLRRTRHSRLSSPRIERMACSALPSWTKPTTALISTTPRITALSSHSPRAATNTAAASST